MSENFIFIQIEDVIQNPEKTGSSNLPLILECDCYYNFNEVAKCILASGHTIKVWKGSG